MSQLVADAMTRREDAPRSADRSSQWALYVFIGVVVAAFPVLLYLGRNRWFLFDEWAFLANRDGGDTGDLFRPHSNHWSTLPILWYRAMWNVVGIRSYLPYQTLLVLLHLTAAVLLRVIMRRADVNAWIATAAASLFVFLGAGSANIVWAFQVNEVGSLVFGLTFLVLVDHDGALDQRDGIGLLAGLAALMCSGFGVAMVAAVGVALLIRRGWRSAALLTFPLAAIYVVWLTTSAWDSYTETDRAPARVVARFVSTGASHGFDAIAQVPGVAVLLAVILVVGLGLAWAPLRGAELRRRTSAPAALLGGAFVFLLLAAWQRAAAGGSGHARASYYTHLFVAMVLPALAIAADAIARRWRVLMFPAIALFLIGIPGNFRDFWNDPLNNSAYHDGYREYMLNAARVPDAEELPRNLRPESGLAPWVTIGWLVDGVASGRVPEPDSLDPETQATAIVRLALARPFVAQGTNCRPVVAQSDIDLQQGQRINVNGGVTALYVGDEIGSSQPIPFAETQPNLPLVVQFPVTLTLTPIDQARPPAVCA